MKHYLRVRAIRGKTYDSAWRQINLKENGDVVLPRGSAEKGLGLRGWMRGPRAKN